jgi:twist-like factor
MFLLDENQKTNYFYREDLTANPLYSESNSGYFHSRHSSTSSFDSTFSIPPESIELVSPVETFFESPAEIRNSQFAQSSTDFIKIDPDNLLPQQQLLLQQPHQSQPSDMIAGPTITASTTTSPSAPTTAPTKRKRTTRRRLTTTQKIAHNKIEKKYRTNINDKIFKLEDLIMAFEDDNCSPQPTDSEKKERPNKSKILERAANFIKHLKATNLKLLETNSALQSQLAEYE